MTIYYWKGVANFDPNQFSAAAKTIDYLLQGDYRETGLEQLRGKNIYSARINDANRLLFTSLKKEGKSYLLLLDIVENHDYDKSRFLKRGVLAKFLKQEGETIANGRIDADSFEAISALPEALQLPIEPTYQAADYYNRGFITLNADQRTAIENRHYPMIVSGAPGSGKSCVALLKLQAALQEREPRPDRQGNILYLCKAPHLAKRMQELWLQCPESHNDLGEPRTEVQFKHYQELLAELLNRSFNCVGLSEFSNWFKAYVSRSQAKGKQGFSPRRNYHPKEVYLEFRNMAAALSFENYQQSGAKKTQFSEENEQRFLFKAYQTYISHLKEQQQIDPDFYIPEEVQPRFERIIVDEAQDLPPAVLDLLRRLCQDNKIAYCIDSRQDLFASRPSLPFLRELFHREQIQPTILQLCDSYRSPKAVLQFANLILDIKHRLLGRSIDKLETQNLALPEQEGGRVHWIDSLEHLDELCSEFKKTDIVILVEEELLANKDWRQNFEQQAPGYILLSAERIKGLEYPCVVLYQPLEGQAFLQANKLLKAGPQSPTEPNNLLTPAFNALMVKATRVVGHQGMLILCQKRSHQNEALMQALQHSSQPVASTSSRPSPAVTTREDWLKAIQKLAEAGHEELAARLRKEKLQVLTVPGSPEEEQPNHHKPAAAAKKTKPSKESPKLRTALEFIQTLETNDGANALLREPKLIEQYDWKTTFFKAELLQRLAKSRGFLSIWKYIQDSIPYKSEELVHSALFQEPEKQQGSAFYWFATTKFGREFLADLFVKHRALLHKLRLEQLTSLPSCDSAIATPLYWLCSDLDALQLLATLFNAKKISRELSAEMLEQSPKSTTGKYANTSPLFWLSKTIGGLKLLLQLFEKNPQIPNSLSPESLSRPLGLDAGTNANTSALYWLTNSGSFEANSILKILFDTNPKLIQGLTAENLMLARNEAAGVDANTSALYYLTIRADGSRLLKTLFEANPKLIQGLTAESLMLARNSAAESYANTSALYWLAGTHDGPSLLKTLFEAKPSLMQDLTAESLMLARNSAAESNANTSALYYLAALTNGQSILKTLLDANPKLIQGLTAESLMLARNSAAKKAANTSVLSALTGSAYGRSLLKTLFDANPKLIQGLTAKSLMLACNEAAGIYVNTSALYWLASSTDGCSLLKTLLDKNPSLIKGLTAKSLILTRNSAAGFSANTSVLYYLAATTDGQSILKTLFEDNSIIIQGLTAESLILARNEAAGTEANASALYWLAAYSQGPNLLKTLFENKPSLIQGLTTESLILARNEAAGEYANTSVLYCLASSPDRRSILKTLFDANPSLIQGLTAESLMLARNDAAGTDANASALYWLAVTEDGHSILNTLFEAKPSLIQGLTAESLMLARNEKAGKYANTSALYWFSYSPNGIALLKKLFESNPALLKQLSVESLFDKKVIVAGKVDSIYDTLKATAEGSLILQSILDANPLIKQRQLHEIELSRLNHHSEYSIFSKADNQIPQTENGLSTTRGKP